MELHGEILQEFFGRLHQACPFTADQVEGELSVCLRCYHFHTNQGIAFFTNAEAAEMAGSDADFHRREIFPSRLAFEGTFNDLLKAGVRSR